MYSGYCGYGIYYMQSHDMLKLHVYTHATCLRTIYELMSTIHELDVVVIEAKNLIGSMKAGLIVQICLTLFIFF